MTVLKKYISMLFVIAIMGGFIPLQLAYAHEHAESVFENLDRIAGQQNVAEVRDIVCEKVSNSDLETLGDALMSRMHDNETHIQMDEMMGGEGSEELAAMHIHIAQLYLGCTDVDFDIGMMMGGSTFNNFSGMMGEGMHSSNFNNYNEHNSMMGFNTIGHGYGLFGGVGMILFWLLIIGGFVFIIIKLSNNEKFRHDTNQSNTSALDILKERYAKGEIDKEEFNSIKKDI